jgi:hypothetical protein
VSETVANRAKFVPKPTQERLDASRLLKEAKMRKLITVGVAVLAIGLWLIPIRAAAQGHGVGRPEGSPGLSGSHTPLGAPGSDAGTGHGSANNTSTPGPKSPTTLLDQNTQLAKKLSSFFPTGTDLTAEASGFKNLGQFVAAVHVSHNMKIPFTELKCTELGTTKAASLGMTCPTSVTNTNGMSLGKAIQTIQPHANSQDAVQTANQETKKDLANAGS